jgi:hypothetical protein
MYLKIQYIIFSKLNLTGFQVYFYKPINILSSLINIYRICTTSFAWFLFLDFQPLKLVFLNMCQNIYFFMQICKHGATQLFIYFFG